MVLLLKVIGAVVLAGFLALGVGLLDLVANDGRLFYRLAGRDALEQDCTPSLRDALIGKGFSPVDISFADEPSIAAVAGSFGRGRSLSGAFSFSDGQEGPRVDGHVLCTVEGRSVRTEVDVDQLPRRVT